MASQTLAEAARFIDDEIALGCVEDIISVNPLYDLLPFDSYTGQAIVVNREDALGDAGFYSIGDTITHKNPAQYETATFTATKLIGDVEMDDLVKAQSASGGVDQLGMEISSKAKKIGRLFNQGMATGTGTSPDMHSFHTLCDSEQYTTACEAAEGRDISFELLDELLDLVLSKDGQVDFIMMTRKIYRKYKTLLRALGGTAADWVVTLPGGRQTIGYEMIPIFRNDYMVETETLNAAALTGGTFSSIYAGVFDDGSRKIGISGLYPEGLPAGIQLKAIGTSQEKDEDIWRLKQYANFMSFNRRGLARATSIK